MRIILSIILGLGIFGPLSALAQDAVSPLASIYQCRDIDDDAERLACYDQQVDRLEEKEEKKEIVAIDAKEAERLREKTFGFSLPSIPDLNFLDIGKDKENEDAMVFTVEKVSILARGRSKQYTVHLHNGMVWEQVSGRINYLPKGDLTATIKKGAIGSYMMSLSNGKERVRGLGVKRIE